MDPDPGGFFKCGSGTATLLSTVNTVLFGQVPPKPYQKNPVPVYLIGLLMDGSGSETLQNIRQILNKF